MNWPTNTIGQVQKKAGPPKPKPKANSWKTVVRIETNEKPAANERVAADAAVQLLFVAEAARSRQRVGGVTVVMVSRASDGVGPEPTARPGPYGLPGFSPAVERRRTAACRLRLSDQASPDTGGGTLDAPRRARRVCSSSGPAVFRPPTPAVTRL